MKQYQIGPTFGIRVKGGVIPSSSSTFLLILCLPCNIPARFGPVHSVPFHPSVQKRSHEALRKQEILRYILEVILRVVIIPCDHGDRKLTQDFGVTHFAVSKVLAPVLNVITWIVLSILNKCSLPRHLNVLIVVLSFRSSNLDGSYIVIRFDHLIRRWFYYYYHCYYNYYYYYYYYYKMHDCGT